MKVDKELIKHVADIARINLSDKEINKFVPEFKEILDAFKILDEVDTKNEKMSIQPVEVKNILREDKETKCFDQKTALSQSKNNKKDGYFKGPKAM